jgi:hypothetical protein
MSIVKRLATETMGAIARSLEMTEVGSERAPYRSLRSPMAPQPVGSARLFQGPHGERLVYIGLTVPMIHLDSHMVFCFTPPDSLLPHFTVDAVHAGEHHAFHLDLIPRVDLAVNLAYMRTVYQPLTPVFQDAKGIPGLSPAQLTPTQLAVMSPWMLAHRASAAAMDAVFGVCGKYLSHWQALRAGGLQELGEVHGERPAVRDPVHRSILFNREVDPVWSQVERLLGAACSEELRALLLGAASAAS